jgi:hypothetical protein
VQQCGADPCSPRRLRDPGRPEEASRNRVVARKADKLAIAQGDEAGGRLAPNRDGSFASPVLAEVPLDPVRDDMSFRSKDRPDRQIRSLSSPPEVVKRRSI